MTYSVYYTGFKKSRFISQRDLKSKSFKKFIEELKEKKITHIFVDGEQLRHLKKKNVWHLEKKSYLLAKIRKLGVQSGHFQLLWKFKSWKKMNNYMYTFNPHPQKRKND